MQAKPGATCLAEQVETGRFPPEIEKIMRLLQNVERIEGLLLQTVSGLALAALPGFDVLTNRRVRVTDADRSLVDSEPAQPCRTCGHRGQESRSDPSNSTMSLGIMIAAN